MIQPSSPLRNFPLSHSRNYSWDENCDIKLKERRNKARELATAKKVYLNLSEKSKKGKKRNHLGDLIESNSEHEKQWCIAKQTFIQAKSNFNKSIIALRKGIKQARSNSWNSAITSITSETPTDRRWLKNWVGKQQKDLLTRDLFS